MAGHVISRASFMNKIKATTAVIDRSQSHQTVTPSLPTSAKPKENTWAYKQQPEARATGNILSAIYRYGANNNDRPQNFERGDSNSTHSEMPAYHEDQPEPNQVSKPPIDDESGEYDARLEFWSNIAQAYRLCHIVTGSLLDRDDLRKDWQRIISTRTEWLAADEAKLVAAFDKNERSSKVRRIDAAKMRRLCRKQEDRLRRLMSGAIEVVAARSTKADEEYAPGMTYDEKVKSTLRDVYEQCVKARRAFAKEVYEA